MVEKIIPEKDLKTFKKTDELNMFFEDTIKEHWNNEENDIAIIKTSTKANLGMDLLQNTVKEMFFKGDISFNDEIFITSLRHKEALTDAYNSLKMVKRSLDDDMPEDFYSIDLMSAYASLGFIIGEEVGEDLVNEIFAKFCMGK